MFAASSCGFACRCRYGLRHLWSCRSRQPQHELAAFPKSLAVCREDAAVQLGDAARQAQSNTQSALHGVGRACGLGEELEDISK